MLLYALKRLLHVIPVTIGVSIVCFMLIHIAPGDPLAAIGEAGASTTLKSDGFAPNTLTPTWVRSTLPLFAIVNVRTINPLVTFWLPKSV